MLPLPGSPSSSWARFRERLKAVFSGANPRVCAAFWLFGALIHSGGARMLINIVRLDQ